MAEQSDGSKVPMVNVRTNGDAHDVPHVESMTVQAAVRAAGMRTRWSTKYFVNGEIVRSSRVLQPGDRVTLAPRARNGQ